jgi:hypothetical protein
MIVPLLREMRAENATWHEQSLERLTAIERRLDKITGEFEQRTEMLERKMREPESQK